MANERRTPGGRDIEERTFRFAIRITRLVAAIPANALGRVFASQIARAGTSIGANIQEAQGSPTKRDFAWRMNIARSEARETLYWLRLLSASGVVPETRLKELIEEADELVCVLTAIVKKARANQKARKGGS